MLKQVVWDLSFVFSFLRLEQPRLFHYADAILHALNQGSHATHVRQLQAARQGLYSNYLYRGKRATATCKWESCFFAQRAAKQPMRLTTVDTQATGHVLSAASLFHESVEKKNARTRLPSPVRRENHARRKPDFTLRWN